jgi:curved DNA-binding protein CbpA
VIPKLLFAALEFYREPRRFDALRNPHSDLPPGVTELLSAPTNCLNEESIADTAGATMATEQELHESVLFFIKQVLFKTGGTYYRVLGVNRDAPAAQIKEHYFYLMRLFHPDKDVNNEGWDDLYAPRINEAYNVLRNPGKRAEYDASLAPEDGFNPAELGTAAVGAAAFPSARAAAESASSAGGNAHKSNPAGKSSARPWMLAISSVIVIAVLAVLAQFVVSSRSTSGLTVTASPEAQQSAAAPQYNSMKAVDALRSGSGNASAAHSSSEQANPEQTSVQRAGLDKNSRAGASEESSGGSAYNREAVSDAEIEARIAQRVNRATVAVLGSRPARSSSAPAKARSVQSSTPRPTQPSKPRPAQTTGEPAQVARAEVQSVPQPGPAAQIQAQSQMPPEATVAVELQTSSEASAEPAAGPEEVHEAQNAASAAAAVVATATLAPAQNLADDSGLPAVSQATVAVATDEVADNMDTVTGNALTISDQQVRAILDNFKVAYETGDAHLFATLFTDNAITTDANGRNAIRKLYASFFDNTLIKQVDFNKQNWSAVSGSERVGTTVMTIVSEPAAGGEEYVARVNIQFELTLGLDPTPLISRMIY